MDHELERLRSENALLRRQAQCDGLTGLYNRTAFIEHAAGHMPAQGGVLVLLDVDHFHRINLRFGYAQGDALLREAALTLQEISAPGDILGRLGGDSFGIFSPTDSCEAVYNRVAQLAGRLNKEDGRAGTCWNVSLSMSVLERNGGEPFQEILERALRVLHDTKKTRKERPSQQDGQVHRMDLARLRSTLREKRPERGAMELDFEMFRQVYRLTERRLRRSRKPASLILLTLTNTQDDFPPIEQRESLMQLLGDVVKQNMRGSDVFTRCSDCQYLLLSLDMTGANLGVVAGRITMRFTARLAPDADVALHSDLAPVCDETL